jgi:hypothetical protein
MCVLRGLIIVFAVCAIVLLLARAVWKIPVHIPYLWAGMFVPCTLCPLTVCLCIKGGLPEGFSRLCAINGGTFMLNQPVDEILFNEDGVSCVVPLERFRLTCFLYAV